MTLAVDRAARTITGIAVPYGPAGRLRGRHFRFLQGWARIPGPVWLLQDHDNSLRVGRAARLCDTRHGLACVLQVRTGRRGDQLLHRTAQGLLGLSVGFDLIKAVRDPDDLSVWLMVAARLNEISLTETPAFETR